MVDPFLHLAGDRSVASSASVHGCLKQPVIGLVVIHLLKPREDETVKVPVLQAGVRNLEGI